MACELASGVVTSYVGQGIEECSYTELRPVTITRRPDADFPAAHPLYSWPSQVGVVDLVQHPVTAVDSVKADGVTLPADEWYWNEASNSILLMEWRVALAEVTYTAGYSPVPEPVRAVCLTIAADMYTNPGGVVAETVGAYSVRFAETGGPGVNGAMRTILDRFRPRVSTVRQS